jgi:regulator of protease activity HflC (stomatin/prohibitin superfamily)
MFTPLLPILAVGLTLLFSGLRVLKEFERGVIFRLGRLSGARGPGVVIVVPIIERMERVDLRTVTMDVPPQDVITKDNVSVKVNAVLYFRVVDPQRAIVEVADYLFATSQLAQTTLRSVCGQRELDELLSERDEINQQIQQILDSQTDPWGIKVTTVEIKHIDLPQEMQRAMARQAEAERERRAKVINAEGELQAAQRLAEASQTPRVPRPCARFRTLGEVATEHNSMTLLPPRAVEAISKPSRSPRRNDAAGSSPLPRACGSRSHCRIGIGTLSVSLSNFL